MTQELLERLPEKVKETMNKLNAKYNNRRFNRDITIAEIRGYINSLRDAELLKSDTEFRAIFCYMTL